MRSAESKLQYCSFQRLFHAGLAIYHSGVIRLLNHVTRNLIVAAIAVVFAASFQAQTQAPAQPQTPASSEPQTQPPAQQPAQPRSQQPAGPQTNGVYISSDPLAGVRYDNRWDVSLGAAYGHIHAGPNLREGANLGGLDLSGSYWLTRRFGLEGSARGYLGTSGAIPNPGDIVKGPFVAQYMFMAGPEYLGPHNKHGAFVLHALFGGSYADFDTDLRHLTPDQIGFYKDQFAFGGALGGHIDLNRSPRWVFRITPDALITGYSSTSQYSHIQWNFGISAGVEYKFKKTRDVQKRPIIYKHR